MLLSRAVDRVIAVVTGACSVRCVLLATVIVTAGCSSGPPPRLYLLEPVNDLAPDVPVAGIESIGLATVTLPDYADDNRIVTRIAGGQVRIDDRERWAEPPKDALSRLLAGQLGAHTDATVLVEPWPRGFEPGYRVELTFDRFLRQGSGGVEMSGHASIISGDGRRVLRVVPFQQTRFARSDEFAAFFEAVAAGINEIGRQIAGVLTELQGHA